MNSRRIPRPSGFFSSEAILCAKTNLSQKKQMTAKFFQKHLRILAKIPVRKADEFASKYLGKDLWTYGQKIAK